jgi:hypothetical protein
MREPHAPRWCIRWHSLPKTNLSYGGLLPESWDTRAEALEVKKRLEREQPVRPNRFRPGVRQPVRYVVFARHEDEVHGL